MNHLDIPSEALSTARCPWLARSVQRTGRCDYNAGTSCPRPQPHHSAKDGQLEVRYQPGPAVPSELQDLVAEERVCCSFMNWTVTETVGKPPCASQAVLANISIAFHQRINNRQSADWT